MKRSQRRKRITQSKMLLAEVIEERLMLSAVSGSALSSAPDAAVNDGTGYNVDDPDWGSTDIELLRLTGVEYADAISDPARRQSAECP